MSRIAGGLLLGEAFQRDQQERLPRLGRDPAEPLLDRQLGVHRRLGTAIDHDRTPDLGEEVVEPHARAARGIEDGLVLQHRFQRRRHVGVARLLAARQGPGVTAQKRHDAGLLLAIWALVPSRFNP